MSGNGRAKRHRAEMVREKNVRRIKGLARGGRGEAKIWDLGPENRPVPFRDTPSGLPQGGAGVMGARLDGVCLREPGAGRVRKPASRWAAESLYNTARVAERVQGGGCRD